MHTAQNSPLKRKKPSLFSINASPQGKVPSANSLHQDVTNDNTPLRQNSSHINLQQMLKAQQKKRIEKENNAQNIVYKNPYLNVLDQNLQKKREQISQNKDFWMKIKQEFFESNYGSEYSTILSKNTITQTDLVDLSIISLDDIDKSIQRIHKSSIGQHFLDVNDESIEEFNESPERKSPGIPQAFVPFKKNPFKQENNQIELNFEQKNSNKENFFVKENKIRLHKSYMLNNSKEELSSIQKSVPVLNSNKNDNNKKITINQSQGAQYFLSKQNPINSKNPQQQLQQQTRTKQNSTNNISSNNELTQQQQLQQLPLKKYFSEQKPQQTPIQKTNIQRRNKNFNNKTLDISACNANIFNTTASTATNSNSTTNKNKNQINLKKNSTSLSLHQNITPNNLNNNSQNYFSKNNQINSNLNSNNSNSNLNNISKNLSQNKSIHIPQKYEQRPNVITNNFSVKSKISNNNSSNVNKTYCLNENNNSQHSISQQQCRSTKNEQQSSSSQQATPFFSSQRQYRQRQPLQPSTAQFSYSNFTSEQKTPSSGQQQQDGRSYSLSKIKDFSSYTLQYNNQKKQRNNKKPGTVCNL